MLPNNIKKLTWFSSSLKLYLHLFCFNASSVSRRAKVFSNIGLSQLRLTSRTLVFSGPIGVSIIRFSFSSSFSSFHDPTLLISLSFDREVTVCFLLISFNKVFSISYDFLITIVLIYYLI